MRSINKVFIIGNVTRDPEMKLTSSGQPIATFGIATNRMWTDKTGKRQTTVEYHNIVMFGRLAEIAKQYLTKGKSMYVEGRLQTRSWEDDRGQRHFRTEIVANEMIILGPRDKNNAKSDFNENELPLDLVDHVNVEESNTF